MLSHSKVRPGAQSLRWQTSGNGVNRKMSGFEENETARSWNNVPITGYYAPCNSALALVLSLALTIPIRNSMLKPLTEAHGSFEGFSKAFLAH